MSAKSEKLAATFGANLSGIVGLRATNPTPNPDAPAAGSGPVDKYAAAIKSRLFAALPVEMIDRDPEQPRVEFDEADLATLAESIRRKGQLQPIRVRWNDDAGRWVVLIGERRWRACKLAGLATIEVRFVEGPITEADRVEEQMMENIARANLKPAEEGKGYQRLMQLKQWTVKDLINELKIEPTAVHRALGLARLPDDVADLVDAGKINRTAAYEMSKLADPDQVRELAAAVVESGLDHKSVVQAVTKRKAKETAVPTEVAAEAEPKVKASKSRGQGGKTPAKPQRPTFEVFRAGGAKITVEFKRAVEPRAILEALEEATTRQRERVDAIEGTARDVA